MEEPSSESITYPSECKLSVDSRRHIEKYPPDTEIEGSVLRSFGAIGLRQGDKPRVVRCENLCGRLLTMHTTTNACTGPFGMPGEIVSNYEFKNDCAREQSRTARKVDGNLP